MGATVSPLTAAFTDNISIALLVLNLATTTALVAAVAWVAGTTVASVVRSRTNKLRLAARRPSLVAARRPLEVVARRPSVAAHLANGTAAEWALPAAVAIPARSWKAVDDEPVLAVQHKAAIINAPMGNDNVLHTTAPESTATTSTGGASGGAGAVPAIRRRRALQAPPSATADSTGAEACSTTGEGAGASNTGSANPVVVVGAVPPSRRVLVVSSLLESRGSVRCEPPATAVGRHDHDPWALSVLTPLSTTHTAGGAGATAVPTEAATVTQLSRAVVVADAHKLRAAAPLAPQPSRRDNRRALRGDSGGDVGVWR